MTRMVMGTRRRWLAWLGVLCAATLGACGGGGSSSSGQASIRMINASPGYAALDLLVDDTRENASLAYGAVGEYKAVDAGSVVTTVTQAGGSTAVTTSGRTLAKDTSYTVVAYGPAGSLKTALLEDNLSAADSGKGKLVVFNTAVDSGSLDVYLTGSDDALDDASATVSAVTGGSVASYSTVTSGTYRLRVTGAGDKNDLRLDVPAVTLGSTQVATLIVTPGSGGVLVHALLLTQGGAAAVHHNTLARARVVASVAANARVSAAWGTRALMTSGASPAIGSYATVTAATVAPQVSVDGVALAVPELALAAGSDSTLLVWGDAAAPRVVLINDDNRLPSTSGYAKLRLFNAVAGLGDALTLTVDFSAIGGDVVPGMAAAYTGVNAATSLRLEVTSPLQVAPLYALSDATLASRGVYTLFVLGESSRITSALRKER